MSTAPSVKNTSQPAVTFSEIVERVKEMRLTARCRPDVPVDACSHYWTRLMNECWRELPAERLTAKEIKVKLKEINGGKYGVN